MKDRTSRKLSDRLSADPSMTRADRIAVAISMQQDGFSARDIARVASLRMETVVEIRRMMGLEPLARGANKGNKLRIGVSGATNRRSLEVVVRSLAAAPVSELPAMSSRLHVGQISAYGIRRAIDYTTAVDVRRDLPRVYRCANEACGQLTPSHPCAHCGHAWLDVAA